MSRILVTIATYDNTFEADLARGLLLDNGIEATLKNELMFSLLPVQVSDKYNIELQVEQSLEEAAREILQKLVQPSGVYDLLVESGAILEGHFLLTSGLHSGTYVEKIKLLQDPQTTARICALLAERLAGYEFDTVVGPAYGGIVLAYEVAKLTGRKFVFAQRQNNLMTIRSGFDLSQVSKVAIVEDIVTTGGSVVEVINCLQGMGIRISVIAAIVDRTSSKRDLGYSFLPLLELDIPAWPADECSLCASGIPLVKPGGSDKTQTSI